MEIKFVYRSREKRRLSDMVLETKVLELNRENAILKAELYAIKEKFGLPHAQVSCFLIKCFICLLFIYNRVIDIEKCY